MSHPTLANAELAVMDLLWDAEDALTARTIREQLYPGDAKWAKRFEKRGSVVVGDVDFTHVAPIASAITPVPGGVGPLTVALLLANTLKASRRRQGAEG